MWLAGSRPCRPQRACCVPGFSPGLPCEGMSFRPEFWHPGRPHSRCVSSAGLRPAVIALSECAPVGRYLQRPRNISPILLKGYLHSLWFLSRSPLRFSGLATFSHISGWSAFGPSLDVRPGHGAISLLFLAPSASIRGYPPG